MHMQLTYIHCHRDSNHEQIDTVKPSILGEAVGDEARSNEVDEVKVQTSIDDQEDAFLNSIPDGIDSNPFRTDL